MTSTATFTRREVAAHAADVFGRGPLTGRKLVDELTARNAPADLIHLMAERVPADEQLSEVRSLWRYLGDLPVDRE